MAYTTSAVAAILSITEPVALVISPVYFQRTFEQVQYHWDDYCTGGSIAASIGDLRQFSLARAVWGNVLLVLSMLIMRLYTAEQAVGRAAPAFQVTAWSQLFATIMVVPLQRGK